MPNKKKNNKKLKNNRTKQEHMKAEKDDSGKIVEHWDERASRISSRRTASR